jgi:hypothetical protein
MKRFLSRKACLRATVLFVGSILWTGINVSYSQDTGGGGLYGLGITDDAAVTFTWKANSEPDLGGYKLYVGTVPGYYAGFIDVGRATSFRVSDLVRGMPYYFALTAYNSSGLESDFTPELTATIPFVTGGGISAVPGAPTNGLVNELTNTTPALVETTNAPPYFDPLPDIVISQDTTNQSVLLLGLTSGADSEADLLISATSSVPELIPNPEVSYSEADATAVLMLAPITGATGSAAITVNVSDGLPGNNFSRTFNVTVEPFNSPPQISGILDLLISKNRATEPIPFTVVDAETQRADLQVTATSSNPEVVPASGLIVTSSGLTSSLVIDPSNGRTGVSTVTITVSDGTASTSTSFLVTIF